MGKPNTTASTPTKSAGTGLLQRLDDIQEKLSLAFQLGCRRLAAEQVLMPTGGALDWEQFDWMPLGKYLDVIESDLRVRILVPSNATNQETDLKSASVGVCLTVLNHLAWANATHAQTANELSDLFYRAKDQAFGKNGLDHNAIYSYID